MKKSACLAFIVPDLVLNVKGTAKSFKNYDFSLNSTFLVNLLKY